MTTSGSCLRIALNPLANVYPVFELTWVWPTPSSVYSTGSSTVRIFWEESLKYRRPAYKVVVLPEPVGPVNKIIPSGFFKEDL